MGPPSSCKRIADSGIDPARVITIKAGESRDLEGVNIRAVFAKHTEDSVGYVLSFGPTRVYITGDTEYDPRLVNEVKPLKPDILIVCINGKWGNMSAADAAKLTAQLNPRVVIPMHYGMFAENTVDPQTFVAEAKKAGVKSKIVILPHMGSYVSEW
jgi:L-ascorbate metabolism protein UlaG (beta-lactamase superfamily)